MFLCVLFFHQPNQRKFMELVSSNAVSQVSKTAERGIDPNFHDERSGGKLQKQITFLPCNVHAHVQYRLLLHECLTDQPTISILPNKRLSLHMSQVAHQGGAYPGFLSMKRLEVYLLLPG